jgi:hypothetical protein
VEFQIAFGQQFIDAEIGVEALYNPATDRNEIWIVARSTKTGRVTHIGEMVMREVGAEGFASQPTMAIEHGAGAFLALLHRKIGQLLPAEKVVGNEWKGRSEAQSENLADLRKVLERFLNPGD